MTTPRHPVLLATVLMIALNVTAGRAQGDQAALARRLIQGDAMERGRALEAAQALGAKNTGPELRAALITLLERNNRIVVQAATRKQALATLEDPEFIAHVAHVVSQLEEPQAIPALAGALGTGSTLVPDALADFGDRAVPAVLAVVIAPESRYSAVDDGLITLRFLVEGAGSRSLSAGALDQIRSAAKQHLTGTQYFTTLWRAIDLAVALKDPDLRRIVASLASDTSEVIARGVTARALIDRTQQQASQRLSGSPPVPRYRSPAERSVILAPSGGR